MDDDGLGWRPDPTGRHQERYFTANGTPTNLVRNDGVVGPDEDRVKSAAGSGTLLPLPGPRDVAVPQEPRTGTGRVLVSKYRAPTEVEVVQGPATSQVVSAQPRPDPAERRTGWWLIGAVCVLLALFVAASLIAYQQHSQATTWMNDYHAAVSANHAEAHKDTTLFVSLLASQQNLSELKSQEDLVCERLKVLTPYLEPALAAACAG